MNPPPSLGTSRTAAAPALARTLLQTARRQVERWAEESQQRACLNARAAMRTLAERRAEIDDVEAFLASRPPRSPEAV